MSAEADRKVSEVGEARLLERIAARIGPARPGEVWAGDDAAVIRPSGSEAVFTTDVLVDEVDFDLSYCTGADVGWKAIAVNVSDVAAMGARPSHAVVGLCLPDDVSVGVVDDLLEGMLDAAARWGVVIVGGDISGARELSLAVTLLGALPRGPLLRSGARPGDALCVTGSLGGAAGGLVALRRDLDRASPSVGSLVERQLRPMARLAEAEVLGKQRVTAMIDVSDGLAVDLHNLMKASGTGCRVDPGEVPVDPALAALARALPGEELDPLTTALTGGEDFELLFTIDVDSLDGAVAEVERLGTQVTAIGEVIDGESVIGGEPLEEWRRRGWEHLRSR